MIRRVNREPIFTPVVQMHTWEVECSRCLQLKWPTLRERPVSYLCRLCLSLPPGRREQKKRAGLEGVRVKKARQASTGKQG